MRGAVLLLLAAAAGCSPALPDPESPGAILLTTRCGGCHRIYAPESMTAAMWAFQVPRMEEKFRQRGMPWLTADEQRQLLEYLTAHAASG